jgi:hypothetical protein
MHNPAAGADEPHRYLENTVMTTIAINGFGRIGRLVFRALVEQGHLGLSSVPSSNKATSDPPSTSSPSVTSFLPTTSLIC